MTSPFLAISLIIIAAALFGALARNFKQPLILGYIFVGILAASFGIFQGEEIGNTLDFLAQLGIAFLLFLIGLELKILDIKYLGKIALFTGIGQVIFTSVIGFFLSKLLGFENIEAAYIAIALTFSSTIIVVKLLTEKRDLNSLYGKITVGFLLVQDLVAILALIFVASLGDGGFSLGRTVFTFFEGALFVGLVLWLSRYVAPYLFNFVAKNTELLFLSSIAWAMLFASLASMLGFSIEIGAFLAGVGLSTLKEEHQIASRIRPLRDLFIVIFFITLGLKLSFSNILANISPAIILSAFVIIGNPIIMMVIMGYLGFRKRTSFLTSISVGQISEFSLVLAALGLKVGHISGGLVTLITLIGIITIGVSSYLILNSSKIYRGISKYLNIFQRKTLVEKIFEQEEEFTDHFVLVGSGRLGDEILKDLKKNRKNVVVVDFNPNIVRKHLDEKTAVLFGDIADEDIFEAANLKKAKMLISTIHDTDDTEEFLRMLREKNISIPTVVTAADTKEALRFYNLGADYVIIPRILSSYYVTSLLADESIDKLISGKLKEKHIKEISEKNRELAGII